MRAVWSLDCNNRGARYKTVSDQSDLLITYTGNKGGCLRRTQVDRHHVPLVSVEALNDLGALDVPQRTRTVTARSEYLNKD